MLGITGPTSNMVTIAPTKGLSEQWLTRKNENLRTGLNVSRNPLTAVRALVNEEIYKIIIITEGDACASVSSNQIHPSH